MADSNHAGSVVEQGNVDLKPIDPVTPSGSAEDKFREFLEIRGEKLTEPRRVLVRHIFDSHKHFDADELVADLRAANRQVSRSTVYRTLRLLVESGLLRELRLTNRTAYEHDFGYPSHDHLHCSGCNQVFEFRNDEIRRLRESISVEHGFRATGHRFIITGVCPKCSRARSPRRLLDLI
ncbi:Fur family transcriptional regulator [Tundrisphaera sp. TA3]|uniref:Fur family transcriptional regulator n=1 Tax=Tundrisphaera sp. TA3 TaxID=3435775 RepID=UPI003EBFAC4A